MTAALLPLPTSQVEPATSFDTILYDEKHDRNLAAMYYLSEIDNDERKSHHLSQEHALVLELSISGEP